MNSYRVYIRSRPGMWELYNGYVDVQASDDSAAIDAALTKLARGAFSDRSRSAWIVEKVERKVA